MRRTITAYIFVKVNGHIRARVFIVEGNVLRFKLLIGGFGSQIRRVCVERNDSDPSMHLNRGLEPVNSDKEPTVATIAITKCL